PYMSWATAATNIQDAVNIASVPGAQVLVTNGTYAPFHANGGPEGLTVRSVNGPLLTMIDGGRSNQCASLAVSVTLSGFGLTNGNGYYGGGAYGGNLIDCILAGNSATYDGAGAYGCVLSNCTLSGNSAGRGGGAYGSVLNNCTLSGNSGSGAYGSVLKHCTLASNTASYGGGAYSCTLT